MLFKKLLVVSLILTSASIQCGDNIDLDLDKTLEFAQPDKLPDFEKTQKIQTPDVLPYAVWSRPNSPSRLKRYHSVIGYDSDIEGDLDTTQEIDSTDFIPVSPIKKKSRGK